MDVREYYDALIEEDNDPVNDPDPLREYMDGWDGQPFFEALKLDKSLSVLELGVGTGRLAVRVAPVCGRFCGIDVSPKTVERAKSHLSGHGNVELICADFITHDFAEHFDRVYSSLTFMHIKEKAECLCRIASLLNIDGILVLSIDKNKDEYIQCGKRRIDIYPDDPTEIGRLVTDVGLELAEVAETPFAYVFTALKV